MERVVVESSLLRSVGYDDQSAVLELQHRNGRIYRYFDVGREVYLELLEASSPGRYFNDSIKDAYRYERVR